MEHSNEDDGSGKSQFASDLAQFIGEYIVKKKFSLINPVELSGDNSKISNLI